MVVLRESKGINKQDEGLIPIGESTATFPDGKVVSFTHAWYSLIGDIHIRFVFDYPDMMPNAKPEDIERLGLNAESALELAVSNIKRTYGEPAYAEWSGGLFQVSGKSPDLDSSYFLDKEFWRSKLKDHPEGLVVCVAKRGGLLYTPLSDTKAVEGIRKGVSYLYSSSGDYRISSALYLFKDDHWSVFQAPIKD